MFENFKKEMKKRNEQTAITKAEYVETLYIRYSGELRNREYELSFAKQNAEKIRSAENKNTMTSSEELNLSYLMQRIADDTNIIQNMLYPLCMKLAHLATGIRFLAKIGRYDAINAIISDRFVNEISQNHADLKKLCEILDKKCYMIDTARKTFDVKK